MAVQHQTCAQIQQTAGVRHYANHHCSYYPSQHHTRFNNLRLVLTTDLIIAILARIMEKQIVRIFLYPVLTHPDFTHLFEDQFAFRPTGSTTAALIYLHHTLTELLQTHDCVHVCPVWATKLIH